MNLGVVTLEEQFSMRGDFPTPMQGTLSLCHDEWLDAAMFTGWSPTDTMNILQSTQDHFFHPSKEWTSPNAQVPKSEVEKPSTGRAPVIMTWFQ